MILLSGKSGYLGVAVCAAFLGVGIRVAAYSRRDADYTNLRTFEQIIDDKEPTLVINCAGYNGEHSISDCEKQKAATLFANTVMPAQMAAACDQRGIPFLQLSTGDIFDGPPPHHDGWHEDDTPNFTFTRKKPPRHGNFYAGSKALSEDMLADFEKVWILRLRLPFSHINHPKNLLSKLLNFQQVSDEAHSFSRLEDVARIVAEFAQKNPPFGTYNVVNPGALNLYQIAEIMTREGIMTTGHFESMQVIEGEQTPQGVSRSAAALSAKKLLDAGFQLPAIETAIADCCKNWIA